MQPIVMSASDNQSKWWDAAFFLFTVRTCQKGIMLSAWRIEHKLHFKGIADLFWRWLKPAASCNSSCLFFLTFQFIALVLCVCVCFLCVFYNFYKFKNYGHLLLIWKFHHCGANEIFLIIFLQYKDVFFWFLKSNWTYSAQKRTYVPGFSELL